MSFKQNDLIAKIKTYLINRDRASFAENLSPGYCRGLTLLFCYFAMNYELESFKNLIQKAEYWEENNYRARKIEEIRCTSQWQEIKLKLSEFNKGNPLFKNNSLLSQLTEMKLKGLISQDEINLYMSGFNSEDPDMEKLIAQMEFLQNTGLTFRLSSNDSAIEMLNIVNEEEDEYSKFKQIFERAAIIPKSNLLKILEKIPNHVVACMSSGRHAFALYKTGTHYYFCDSNFGVSKIDNAAEVVKKILETTYEETKGTDIPFAVEILTKDWGVKLDVEGLVEQFQQGEKSHISSPNNVLNDYPTEGTTACILAVTSNLSNEVKRLTLELNDADLNVTDCIGLSPLHYAALTKHLSHAKDLINGGANVNLAIAKRSDLNNALDATGEWFYRSIEGATPLHIACIANDIEMVNFLLENKADINAVTKNNLTPLIYAALNGHNELTELLLAKGANRDISVLYHPVDALQMPTFPKEKRPLEWIGAVRNLLEYDGANAVLCAAKNNHFDTVFLLLQNGFKVDVNCKGIGLLHWAVMHQDLASVEKLSQLNVDINSLALFQEGSDALISPLWIACTKNNKSMVALLLGLGAKINNGNPKEMQVLDEAIKHESVGLIQVFIDHGVSPKEIFMHSIKNKKWLLVNHVLQDNKLLMDSDVINKLQEEKIDLPVSVTVRILSFNAYHPEYVINNSGELNLASSILRYLYKIEMQVNSDELVKLIISTVNMYAFSRDKKNESGVSFFKNDDPCLALKEELGKLEEKFDYLALIAVFDSIIADKKYNSSRDDIELIAAIKIFISDYEKLRQPLVEPSNTHNPGLK